jgi:FSR family fosmidomycin resistance protein-like MFS transporter
MPSLVFTAAIIALRKTVVPPARAVAAGRETGRRAAKGAYTSLVLTIAVVVMRSWIQVGIMAYIPFYFINELKGDPVYAAKLVSVFLFGGAIGTLAGAPVADKYGHRFLLRASMFVTAILFPLTFLLEGKLLLVLLFVMGAVLVATFSVTVVMAQHLLPENMGVASGLMTGFAIGVGGVGVTLLGVVADHFGVAAALKSIALLPVTGLALSLILRYPPERDAPG